MHVRHRNLVIAVWILTAGMLFVGCGTREKGTPAKPEPQTQQGEPAQPETPTKAGDYQLSGPFTHDNLSIFLIHGEDRLKNRKFILLAEALEKKLIVINETQNVNTLTMENVSSSEEVLVLSGDILKGGQQDRIAQYDQFVPPKSGKQPLTVFCVEHTAGRWMRAMTKEDKKFHASPGQISSNLLRLSNRHEMNQSEVWINVAKAQAALSKNAGKDVKAKESDSSLALSLQSKEVKAAADKYVAKLMPVPQDKGDVIGYAFAINGKIYTADVYGSPALFQKVWPRLIKASAIEAFAERKKNATFPPATVAAVKSFLEEGDKGKVANTEVTKDVRQVTNAAAKVIRFETIDAKKEESIRRNYEKR